MNRVALRRNEVKLITRKPTPTGMGTYIVGIQSPWMKLSQAANLFGIWSLREADWRVMMPTAYGDNSRISPMNDFLSKFLTFFSKFVHKKILAFLIFDMITHIGLILWS